jgi:hypothetical protein
VCVVAAGAPNTAGPPRAVAVAVLIGGALIDAAWWRQARVRRGR